MECVYYLPGQRPEGCRNPSDGGQGPRAEAAIRAPLVALPEEMSCSNLLRTAVLLLLLLLLLVSLRRGPCECQGGEAGAASIEGRRGPP